MENQQQSPQKSQNKRKRAAVLFLTLLILLAGLATLASSPHDSLIDTFVNKDNKQQPQDKLALSVVACDRATIYDRNFNRLAVSYKTHAVYARPLELDQPDVAAKKLSALLDLDESKLAAKLKSERIVAWIGREIEPSVSDQIKALNLKGIYLINEMNRFYPNKNKAAHLIGYANNEQGLDGIEFLYDSLLQTKTSKPTFSDLIDTTGKNNVGEEGVDLVLTIDLRIQSSLEKFLKKAMKKHMASSAAAALISPETGAILALANLPTFDPNCFWEFSNEERNNRLISQGVFPGDLSNFFQQTITFDETKKVSLNLIKNSDTSKVKGQLILPRKHKRKKFDRQAFLTHESLGPIAKHLQNFPKYKVDLPLHKTDYNNELAKYGDIIPTGNGLQLLTSFSYLVNGGKEIKPHLLSSIWDRATANEFPAKFRTNTETAARSDHQKAALDVLKRLGKAGPSDSISLEVILTNDLNLPVPELLIEPSEDSDKENEFKYVMLGVAPDSKQNLTMVVIMDGIKSSSIINSIKSSKPILTMPADLICNSINWCKNPKKTAPPVDLAEAVDIKKGSTKKREKKMEIASLTAEIQKPQMPELTGKSLRYGLQTLQQFNLRISVIGSGMIVAQHPAPGAPFNEGDSCVLKLQTEH